MQIDGIPETITRAKYIELIDTLAKYIELIDTNLISLTLGSNAIRAEIIINGRDHEIERHTIVIRVVD